MKRLLLMMLLIFTISASIPSKKVVLKTTIKEHWRTKIGCTTYRTIPIVEDGKIYIGSNGKFYRDIILDEGNGIYILNSKTGSIYKNFDNKQFGDMDVNGILSLNNFFYYGNDNDEFLCVDADGNTIWRVPTGGDVEHKPSFIKINNQNAIVYATETGQIQALDAVTGKVIWNHYDKRYTGWKFGENREYFKIKMHISEDNVFFNEPSLADLNEDNVSDLIYNKNWGDFCAIDGKTGKLLWDIEKDDLNKYYIMMEREKPLLIGNGKKTQIMLLEFNNVENKYELAFYNAKGKLIERIKTNLELGMTMISQTTNAFITSTAVIIPGEKPKDVKIIPIENSTRKNDQGKTVGKYYNGQVAANKINFNDEPCALIVYQYDPESKSDQSPMLLIGMKTGKVHLKVNLPSRSEFAPFITDVNHDGKLDVLVGCYDEYLYCFDLDINSNQLINN
jgi:outer membrane protein assembly factor BamB